MSDYTLSVKSVMECGHVSNAIKNDEDGTRIPVCSLCLPILLIKASTTVDVSKRLSKCRYCGEIRPSGINLHDYFYSPSNETDTHYDGCQELVDFGNK